MNEGHPRWINGVNDSVIFSNEWRQYLNRLDGHDDVRLTSFTLDQPISSRGPRDIRSLPPSDHPALLCQSWDSLHIITLYLSPTPSLVSLPTRFVPLQPIPQSISLLCYVIILYVKKIGTPPSSTSLIMVKI